MTLHTPFDAATCWQLTLALVHVGWLGIGIAAVAGATNWLLRKASADCRYWLNFAALLLLGLCLPVCFTAIRLTSGAARCAVASSRAIRDCGNSHACARRRCSAAH